MNNPFETITQELSTIKALIIELSSKSIDEEKSENLTVKETAELLKVSEQSVHNYIKRGFLKAQKVGRILLIKREAVENALTEVKSLKYKRE